MSIDLNILRFYKKIQQCIPRSDRSKNSKIEFPNPSDPKKINTRLFPKARNNLEPNSTNHARKTPTTILMHSKTLQAPARYRTANAQWPQRQQWPIDGTMAELSDLTATTKYYTCATVCPLLRICRRPRPFFFFVLFLCWEPFRDRERQSVDAIAL